MQRIRPKSAPHAPFSSKTRGRHSRLRDCIAARPRFMPLAAGLLTLAFAGYSRSPADNAARGQSGRIHLTAGSEGLLQAWTEIRAVPGAGPQDGDF